MQSAGSISLKHKAAQEQKGAAVWSLWTVAAIGHKTVRPQSATSRHITYAVGEVREGRTTLMRSLSVVLFFFLVLLVLLDLLSLSVLGAASSAS